MGSTVNDDEKPENEDGKSLGVRFAESRIGKPIVGSLLFVTGSVWLTVTGVGLLLLIAAFVIGEGVPAGIIGTFGVSGVFVGVLGYTLVQVLKYRKD